MTKQPKDRAESNTSSLQEYRKTAIGQLLSNGVLVNAEQLEKYNSLNSKEEITSYTNNLIKEKKQSDIKEIFEPKETGVKIISSYNDHPQKREVSDFVIYYNNRYQQISKILKKKELENLTSIGILSNMKSKEKVSAIGMIYDISETKNGHISISLEDRSGIIKALVLNTNEELYKFAKNLVLDEVIGVTGYSGKNVLFLNDIFLPEEKEKEKTYSDKEEYVAIIGDLHIGSKIFYEKEFKKFVTWLEEKGDKISSKVKYLVIAGDLVEGIGIFPNQENELKIKSITEQYNYAASLLEKISKDIQIIICPGNHDAVRLAEPQPKIPKKYVGKLANMKNITFVSSPSNISIGKTKEFKGIDLMLYHGMSMPHYGDNVESIRNDGGVENTEGIMKFFLKKRHLAPSYGSTQFIPDTRFDPMLIENVPDVLVTGHIHKVSVNEYKSTMLINASTWVAPNDYQGRFGIKPDCCKAILYNLKTREAIVKDFEEHEN